MVKPREEVEDKEYFRDIHFLYEIINQLKAVNELKLFLKDILTPAELRMFKKRWHITRLLSEGIDVRTTAQMTRAGTNTVLRIKRTLEEGQGGLKVAIKRMNEAIQRDRKNYLDSKNPRQSSKFVKGWFKSKR